MLEAWRNKARAVVVDQHGLNDLRGETDFVPWHRIETVRLDLDEQRILVDIATAPSRGLAGTTRRLLSGADYTVALGGLSYKHRELAKALAEHHRHRKAGSIGNASASDT